MMVRSVRPFSLHAVQVHMTSSSINQILQSAPGPCSPAHALRQRRGQEQRNLLKEQGPSKIATGAKNWRSINGKNSVGGPAGRSVGRK